MRVFTILVLLVFGSLSTTAFTLLKAPNAGDDNYSAHPKGFGTAKYALIVGIDGFGGVYLKNVSYRYPALQSFFDVGAHTTTARNVVPTVSGPNWASYLTSMHANQHGVYDNAWTDPDGNPPTETDRLPPISGRGRPQTLFSVIKEHNEELKTALMFTWHWFSQIAVDNPHVDYWFLGHDGITCGKNESEPDCSNRQDWNVQQTAAKLLQSTQPTLTFLHFDAVDAAGHGSHWGSDLYYEMVQQKELQLQGLLQTLENITTKSGARMIDETIIVVVADHGGYKGGHGYVPPMICEAYVPLLIRGPGVKNVNLEDTYTYGDVSSLDMTVTVLNALGIEKGRFMRGRVLEEIYGDDATNQQL